MKSKQIFIKFIGITLAIIMSFISLPVFHSPITVNAAQNGDYNLLLNGSFENDFSSWIGTDSSFSTIFAHEDGLTAPDGEKIVKVNRNNGIQWGATRQDVNIAANTDYLFTMWVYQPDSNSKLILKIGTPSSHTEFTPNKTDYNIWQKHTTKGQWVKITLPFNSGSITSFRVYLVVSGGITYIDNVTLKKQVAITTTAQGGIVSGIPDTILQGDEITLTAVPDAGYGFDGWYKDNECLSTTACYTFNAVNDMNLQAKFKVTHNLIADYSFEGTALNSNWKNSSGRGSISTAEKSDGNQSLHIEQRSGYQNIYYWPITVEPNSKYRITMKVKIPSGAAIPIIKVLDNGGSGNSILNEKNSDGNTWFNSKNNKIVAGCDWQDAYFTFNSGDLTKVSLLLTGNGTAEAYIDELYITKYFNISVSADEGGSVSGFSNNWAFVDTPIELTTKAEIGYKFDGWYKDDIKLSAEPQLKFNITEDCNIKAHFIELKSYIADSGFELQNLHNSWENNWNRGGVSSDEFYDGKQSLHFAKTDLSTNPYIQQEITIKPNTNYMVKMMVNIPRDSSAPILHVVGENDNHLINERNKNNNNYFINGGNSFVSGTGWFPVMATFKSGSNSKVKIRFTGATDAEAYIDNLILNESYTATILVGENGSVERTTVSDVKYETISLVAKPDDGYMVEGWYIDGNKVSSKKQYDHILTENINLELKFTISTLPVMTSFDLAKLWCNDSDNLLTDSSFEEGTGIWNKSSFIKNGVLDVVELDGDKVLYFNPDGEGRQVMYFPVILEADTEYMFSANVKGKYYSETNHFDMSFGIMDINGEYLTLNNPKSSSYYDETPNVTTTKSITPPSWDNNWHRRGITFKTIDAATILIAVSGNLSEAYLDDFILCKISNAIVKPNQKALATVTDNSVDFDASGCNDSDNLVKNYNFNNGSEEWEDGYGWNGMFSGTYVGETGQGNKALFMHSSAKVPDYHYYIKWIDVKPNTEYTLSLAAATTSEEANIGLLVSGEQRYTKLVSWSIAGNRKWNYKAVSFNTKDNISVGIFVMNGGRVTVLDEIRLFESSNATAITNKLSGKADIPEEVVSSASNQLVNGSFENKLKSWSTNYTSDFTVVDAKETAPVNAVDGEKILKVTASGEWHAINQNLMLEANKEYIVSFWYYRDGDGYMSLKFGNNAADNGWLSESWLNNDDKNEWVYKKWTVNTTDDTALKLFLCAFDGTVYIDDVRVTLADDIGNLVQNGDMSSSGKALNSWIINSTKRFNYESNINGYTGNGVAKISGDGYSFTKYNMTYTVAVKANTDYVFRFYAKNSSVDKKMYYDILNSNDSSIIGGNKYTEGNGTDWGKNELCFNSGNNTTVKIRFIENSNGTTYIDDIYFGEAINISMNSSNETFGSVFGDKLYVGEDDAATYTVTTTQGGELLGWSINGCDYLIIGDSYTYKDFEDANITAVFKAKAGNLNEDANINILDLAILRNILLEDKEYIDLGDLNDDREIDARDVVSLKKQIAYLN